MINKLSLLNCGTIAAKEILLPFKAKNIFHLIFSKQKFHYHPYSIAIKYSTTYAYRKMMRKLRRHDILIKEIKIDGDISELSQLKIDVIYGYNHQDCTYKFIDPIPVAAAISHYDLTGFKLSWDIVMNKESVLKIGIPTNCSADFYFDYKIMNTK